MWNFAETFSSQIVFLLIFQTVSERYLSLIYEGPTRGQDCTSAGEDQIVFKHGI